MIRMQATLKVPAFKFQRTRKSLQWALFENQKKIKTIMKKGRQINKPNK